MSHRVLAISVCAAAVCLAAVALRAQPAATKKALIAHRGASAYAPEHSADAYKLAMAQGADFVEQDLAVTKDGVLVSIHDLTLERTTDVEEVFPTRFVEEKAGDKVVRRWLVHDFTLAEIKQLDAGSWMDRKFAGTRILTFQEAIDLVRGKAGLYPELKDPEFYRQRGVNPVKLFADVVKKNGLEADPKTPLILQSFDEATLKAAAVDLPTVPRVFLVSPQDAGRIDTPDKLKDDCRLGERHRAEQGHPGEDTRHRRVGARGEADGDALDLPRVERSRQVRVSAGGDEALSLHARGRCALHRQPRHVPADEVESDGRQVPAATRPWRDWGLSPCSRAETASRQTRRRASRRARRPRAGPRSAPTTSGCLRGRLRFPTRPGR